MKVDPLPGDELSDVRYTIGFDLPAFTVGFRLASMIESLVYVVLEPGPGIKGLKKSHLLQLRAKLNEFSHYTFFCQVDNGAGYRFARFFGFEAKKLIGDRIHMVKEKL